MDQRQLRSLLEQVRAGAVDIDSALEKVRHMPFEDLGFAKVDHHRELRHGMPEVVLAAGKTPEQVVAIVGRLLEHSKNVLIEGVSLISNYRTQFNKIITTSSYQELVKKMKSKQEEFIQEEKRTSQR